MAAYSICPIQRPTSRRLGAVAIKRAKEPIRRHERSCLSECGSHATIALHIGRYEEAELHGAYALLPQVSRGMLLMHDANFFGGAYLEALNAKGGRALFALPSTVGVQRRRNLPDGSYLALLKPNAQAVYTMQQPVWVRVIEYQLTDERLGEP